MVPYFFSIILSNQQSFNYTKNLLILYFLPFYTLIHTQLLSFQTFLFSLMRYFISIIEFFGVSFESLALKQLILLDISSEPRIYRKFTIFTRFMFFYLSTILYLLILCVVAYMFIFILCVFVWFYLFILYFYQIVKHSKLCRVYIRNYFHSMLGELDSVTQENIVRGTIDSVMAQLSGCSNFHNMTKKEINDANKRKNKEAKNHQHQHPNTTSNKPAVNQESTELDEELGVIPKKLIQFLGDGCIAFIPPNSFVPYGCELHETELHKSYKQGTYEYIQVGYGMFDNLMNFNMGSTIPHSFIKVRYVPTMVFGSLTVKVDRTCQFCYPLLLLLQRAFPKPSPEQRNIMAVDRYLEKQYNSIPLGLRKDTFYVYLSFIGQTRDISQPIDGKYLYDPAILSEGQYGSGEVFRINPVNSQFPEDWAFNQRWRVLKSKGWGFSWDKSKITQYPRFNTLENHEPKYINTAFMRVLGHQAPSYYEVNGFNCTNGLSRLFKQRANEETLFSNQLALLRIDLPGADHVLKLAGAIITTHPDASGDNQLAVMFRPTLKVKNKWVENIVIVPELDPRIKLYHRHRITVFSWYGSYWILFLVAEIIRIGIEYYNQRELVYECVKDTLVFLVYAPLYFVFSFLDLVGLIVLLPTPKRPLYTQWYWDDNTMDRLLAGLIVWELQIKPEPGKFMKAVRLFGSGQAACLLDRLIPQTLKYIYSKPIHLHEIIPNSLGIRFTMNYSHAQDPYTSDVLYGALQFLIEGEVRAVFFSDDGFICWRRNGRLQIFETDISACDASCGPGLFSILHIYITLLTNIQNADALIAQCAQNATMRNPSNSDESFTIQPESFFMYSGWILTTPINNIANEHIFLAVYLAILDGRDMEIAIVEAAHRYGWVVTSNPKSDLASVSFLKRSFSGISFVGYGTIIRSLGIIEGKFTPQAFGLTQKEFLVKSEAELFEIHLKQRVLSLVNEPVSCFINALRSRVGLPEVMETLSLIDLQYRYGGEDVAWYDFCSFIASCKIGDVFSNTVTQQIMEIDYGITKLIRTQVQNCAVEAKST